MFRSLHQEVQAKGRFWTFSKTPVTGALAASLFHFGELKIEELKKYLEENGVNVRR